MIDTTNELVRDINESVTGQTSQAKTVNELVKEIRDAVDGVVNEDQIREIVAGIIGSAPEALDTLGEIADALSEIYTKAEVDTLLSGVDDTAKRAEATVSSLQTQFDQAMTALTEDSEVQNARVGYDNVQYSTLKARLDAENADLRNAIENVSGLSDDAKIALLNCFQNVAWINEDGQAYYDALYESLYPRAASITVTFSPGSKVFYETDSLNDLRPYLIVRASMSDGTIKTITNYSLSGSMKVGINTITVHYQGKADTFDVTVAENPAYITAVFTQPSTTIYTDDSLDTLKSNLVVTYYAQPGATGTVVADSAYTLIGTLTEGTSIIRVEFNEKATTFTVVVSAKTWDFEWDASTKQAPSNMEARSFDFTTHPGFMYANNMDFYIENSVGDGEIEFHGFVPLHAYLETTPRIYLKSGTDGNMGVGFAWLFNCADGGGKTVRAWTGNNKNYLDIDQTVEADFRLKVENGVGYWFYNDELVFSSNDPTHDAQLLGTGIYTVVDNTYICVSSIKYRRL